MSNKQVIDAILSRVNKDIRLANSLLEQDSLVYGTDSDKARANRQVNRVLDALTMLGGYNERMSRHR